MITSELQHNWLQQHLGSAVPAGIPGWLQRIRENAGQTIADLPTLDRSQEDWRYTSVEKLLKQQFRSPQGMVPDTDALRGMLQDCAIPELDTYRIVMVNGLYMPDLSDTQGVPGGVTLDSVRNLLSTDPSALSTWFGQTVSHTENIFTALNTALTNDGAFIHINSGATIDRPIEVIYLAIEDQDRLLLQPRNLIVLEEGASATLIERFISNDNAAAYFHNHLSEIVINRNASLTHYRIQDENDKSHHLSNMYLSQQSHSHYHGTTLAFGAIWNRTEYHTVFKQENAACELNGLSVVGDGQLSDFHLKVHHSSPGCTSRERFKSILHGKGRAVFDGYIRVDKQAQKSDAELTNDNLMLTRDAEVDTKPQLEIYADDVKCSHGTTIGELDQKQIFYLRSRGIDEVTARGMLCLGFANDIIDSIELPPLHHYVVKRLEDSLGSTSDKTG